MNDDQINESIRLAREAAAAQAQKRADEAARVQKLEERKRKARELKQAASKLPAKASSGQAAILNFLDWRFDNFVTLWICRVLYVLFVAITTLSWLGTSVAMIAAGSTEVTDAQRNTAMQQLAAESLFADEVAVVSRDDAAREVDGGSLRILYDYHPDLTFYRDAEKKLTCINLVAVYPSGKYDYTSQSFDSLGDLDLADTNSAQVELGFLDSFVINTGVVDPIDRFFLIITSLFSTAMAIVVVRLVLEAIVVIFKIQENTAQMRS